MNVRHILISFSFMRPTKGDTQSDDQDGTQEGNLDKWSIFLARVRAY